MAVDDGLRGCNGGGGARRITFVYAGVNMQGVTVCLETGGFWSRVWEDDALLAEFLLLEQHTERTF